MLNCIYLAMLSGPAHRNCFETVLHHADALWRHALALTSARVQAPSTFKACSPHQHCLCLLFPTGQHGFSSACRCLMLIAEE